MITSRFGKKYPSVAMLAPGAMPEGPGYDDLPEGVRKAYGRSQVQWVFFVGKVSKVMLTDGRRLYLHQDGTVERAMI